MYYILFAFFYLVSLLPIRVLYFFSHIARFVVFDIIKYRKNVVKSNLSFSFPEKNSSEIRRIQRDFELSFCDQWIEVVKLISMSRTGINKMIHADWAFFNRFFETNKNVHVFLGHQFNWELANLSCQLNTFQQFYGVYLPLSSTSFDRLMLYVRKRTGSHLINAQNLRAEMKSLFSNNHILGVIADQSSNNLESSYWYRFLNRPCPFTFVPEKTARFFQSAVVFASTIKLSRGRYKIDFVLISENAGEEDRGLVMDKYVHLLEKSIQEQPFNWLWSHKRWKRQLPEGSVVRGE